MLCCIAIGFFELPGLAGGFLYTKKKNPNGFFFLEVPARFELANESFADSCLTTWPRYRVERVTRLELATSTLARWRSTG